MKTISNRIIRKLSPCYDPAEVVKDENEELPVKEWVAKYRNSVKNKSDIIWLLCNKLFMSNKDMRLFALWCAREALRLVESPDSRSIEACNVAERYAKGKATIEELNAAETAARNAWSTGEDAGEDAAWAAWAATRDATRDATRAAARAAWVATLDTVEDAQIDQLMTYF